ncbi:hypothetical protein [Aestuariicoccus sp. MJ-SS9]|nr:hypothetical protein [Aestuariicoccus sp. MJ-SS9]MDU8913531.1 hypothetical protein [Aestuariicoccus sp. MJ-SS9]
MSREPETSLQTTLAKKAWKTPVLHVSKTNPAINKAQNSEHGGNNHQTAS